MRPALVLLITLFGCQIPTGEKTWTNEGPGETIGGDGGGADGADGGTDTGDTGEVGPDWDTACNPLNIGGDCLTPFPASTWMVADPEAGTGWRLSLSPDSFRSPDGPLPVDPGIFNFADGASPIAPLLVNLGVDVDPTQLWNLASVGSSLSEGALIALIHLDTGERVPLLTEMDQRGREGGYEGRHALIIRPMAPLVPGARYGVVLHKDLRDVAGEPLPESPVFNTIRDGAALGEHPTLIGLTERLEAAFPVFEAAGYPREDIHLAWEFVVGSAEHLHGPIRSMRSQTLADVDTSGVPYTIEEVRIDPHPDVAVFVRGRFSPPNFLDGDNRLVLDGTAAVLQEERPDYEFTLVVPARARTERGLPLAVIGHGLFGTGRGMLDGGTGESLTWPLANRYGVVLVATDWIGLASPDLDLIISEVLPDIARVDLVTDRLAQSLVNNLSLVALTQGALGADPALGLDGDLDGDGADDAPPHLIDPENLLYYGGSLGGIQGASFVALHPNLSRAVLSVPGAGWAHMIQRSINFEPLELVVDALYPDPLSQQVFITLLQHKFDRSDPGNLTLLLGNDPDHLDRPAPVVVLQEAVGDVQVPNLATEVLARAMGASHLEEAARPIAALPTVSSPQTSGVVLTQVLDGAALSACMPPDANLLSTCDNSVHWTVPTGTLQLLQLEELIATSTMVHLCEGPCDPE